MAPIRTRGSQATATNPVEQTSLEVLSRRLTRMTDMFFCTTSLLNLGKETHGMDKQSTNRTLPTFRQITNDSKFTPDCRRVVNRDTGKSQSLVKARVMAGREDMRKMIKLMDDERVWTWGPLPGPAAPEGIPGLKSRRMCILTLSPRFRLGRPAVRTHLPGSNKAQRWPRFCWLACKYNPTKPSEGLLYSELLIEGGKGLLLSLSSVDNIAGAPGARGSGAKRKNNKGLAKRYKINRVTTPFIAYVRHALTSDTQFDEICDGFNYPTFYRELKQYLEAPSFASRAKALVGWWNQRIFGDIYFGPEEPEESQEFNTLTALLAEVEGDNEGSGQENSED
ncbi:hypothetical protein RHS01_08675 [Rhizoctonia solani]|uniref:Uncharacterized protein n=1 Tax=Rhizoctonia solani TaxID=456999 RepID=A0A8H7I8A1_9AGAM|nr:hypothetical protein RHS01_08675 [Rhizoctonia solani]